ncbi:MAG: hypothetical protein JW706_08455, partial [Opitutales bacterium]|nr:hypothetical protein [Opitutales bacterium]
MKGKRWIILGAVWMLVFAAMLWFESGVMEKEGMRFLRFFVTAEQGGTVQVFFDRGAGFREEDSVRRRIPAKERQNIVIPLGRGTYKGFRIDPVDNASRYELSVIEITRISGETERSLALSDWFSHGSDSRVEDATIVGGGAGASPDPWHALAFDPPLVVEEPSPG